MDPSIGTRSGHLASNIVGFGRALRRAGVAVDAHRIALSIEAAVLVGVEARDDLCAAMEAVMISRAQDRAVFRELFEAWYRLPGNATQSLAPLSSNIETRQAPKLRPRVRQALSPGLPASACDEGEIRFDTAMTASELRRLQQANFDALDAAEYRMVERLAREMALPFPALPSRRWHVTSSAAAQGHLHWPGVLREAARSGGELLLLPQVVRRTEPLPLLVLIDVSGSMQRYARLVLTFLHSSLRRADRCDVFAFGTSLYDLTRAFKIKDTDAMLEAANAIISDFAGGTRLGDSLNELRHNHARRLTGRRTIVLLISDGLDTGEPRMLEKHVLWLKLHTRRLLWLNPLLRFDGYLPVARGAAVLHRHADAMLAVHNLQALDQLATGLADLIRSGGR